MIKHKSKFEVRSPYQGYLVPPHARSENPSMESRRRGPSISSSTKLNANKYSISNANHTVIDHNYTYNVYKYTIYDDYISINGHDYNRKIDEDKGLYGSYIYDNDNYNMYVNGIYTCNDENYSRDGEGKCNDSSYRKESGDEEEDSFTFSSVADSMDFFSSAYTSEAEACMHGRPSMSSADELFQDGKIRPLIRPIINGHNHFQDGNSRPSIQPISNGHDQPMNLSKPSLDQHASFNQFAAQYLASANHCVIKQESHAEKRDNPLLHQGALDHGLSSEINQKLLHQRELDHGLSSEINKNLLHHGELDHGLSTEINQKSLHHGGLDHGLSTEINQKLKHMCNDQLELEPNHGGSPLQILSLSAPTSPVKEILADEHNDNHGSHQVYSVVSTSQVSCYKRSRSLSRVFQVEDNEQILEVQDLVEDGTKGGGFLNYKRKTLQDLLTQEGSPMSKPHEMVKEPYKMKQLGLASPNRNAKNFYDAERRPSLAPAPINIPTLWPVREKLCAAPTTHGKSSKAPSPHELHYASQKAQEHRFKKKTFLPYRPGLLGCLGYPP